MNMSSRKRGLPGTEKNTVDLSKRPRMIISNGFDLPKDLHGESSYGLSVQLQDHCQTSPYRNFPHHLIKLMYQVDLSMLCLLRKFKYEYKYPSLSLLFENSEIDKFRNIVLHFKKKSIYVQVENVDKYYKDNIIDYIMLFAKVRQKKNSINDYFNSFVKHLISKPDSSMNIMHLVIYTNSGLDLTEEKKLKRGLCKNFYPFKFDSVDMEECNILRDFLLINERKNHGFYHFSQEGRAELLKRLEFSFIMKKELKERKFSQEFEKELKEIFLDKLIFAVNQPNREELNSIIKNEIEKIRKAQFSYITLQKEMLCVLTKSLKKEELKNYIPEIIYEFDIFKSFLHCMFLHEGISSMNLERKSHDINNITIHYKNKIIFIKAYNVDNNIGYSQLFPSRKQEKNKFSINKHFSHFIEELKNIKYFVIFTNVDLDLTEEKRLKKAKSKGFYPLKFDNIDIERKKYKILKDCLCINEYSLYQFSKEEMTRVKLLTLLQLPPSLQKGKKEGKVSDEDEKEIKEFFLDKLKFAVNQPNKENLNNVVRNKIEKSNVPYNYEKLNELTLRWLESHEFSPITKGKMEKLLEDIKNKRSSYQGIQNKNINKEIKFAKSVVGRKGTSAFVQFVDFLIKGRGVNYLEILKRKGIKLSNMSSILHGAGTHATKAFNDLYGLWFDSEGNKTQYLKALEEEGINLANISSILHGARANAAKAFKNLYDLWFDAKGNKTQYLKVLEKNGMNLTNMSSILSGAGSNAAESFRDLYDLWFDSEGNKTHYLKTLKEEGINLVNISSILGGTGTNAAKVFKDLYDLWFDTEGNKTQYLKTLEKEDINLVNMSSILHRARVNAVKAFKDLYDLWFNVEGNKTHYLKTLQEEGINLANISSILGGAGTNAAKAFKDLYDFWFSGEGNKTYYLNTLEDEGISLTNISSILSGTGANAVKAFKDIYNLWFDTEGNKTQYLKTLQEEGIDLASISSILGGAGINAAKAFKNLYELWFDAEGKKTQYLKVLEKEGINIVNMSSILHRARASAAKAFKELYDMFFDKEGNKTQYLRTLEEEGVNLTNISSILGGAGAKAASAFKDLYDLWFDEQGNKKLYLKHFTEKKDGKKGFTINNLSSILSGAGVKAEAAFKILHYACFNDEGVRTELLDDFYNAGFRPSSLSCMLCKTGVHAASILKRLHCNFFNEKREKTKFLDDFYNAGFRPGDLCSILSAAADNLQKFHNFCFIGETKKYLDDFLREGFTPKNLSNILHGARANICSALKDFHDVCFDKMGNKTLYLDDFYNAGFRLNDLSRVLTMSGNNAAAILRHFHQSSFNENRYLNHFLAQEELFTPKNLSKILYGVGINIYPVLQKLHDLCFDKAGNKTQYFSDLINANHKPAKLFSILRRASTVSIPLYDQSFVN